MVRICDELGECHSYRNVFAQQYTVYNKQAVNALFDRLDANFDNKISIGELDEEFSLFDTNNDDFIDATEMQEASFYVFFGLCETDEALNSRAYLKEQ
jgi:Ca2+-binding EF-hand superfamily protein